MAPHALAEVAEKKNAPLLCALATQTVMIALVAQESQGDVIGAIRAERVR